MKHKFQIIFILIFTPALIYSSPVPWGNGQSKAEDLRFKLVTFGIGDDIPSYWGHIGLVVEDVRFKVTKIYNFGLFSFGDDFVYRFLKGELIFSAGAGSLPAYLSYYKNQKREIRISDLNIPLNNRIRLAEKLAWNALPENRDYVYDHYWDNCSTRLRDLLNEAFNGRLFEAADTTSRMNLRQHTRRYTSRNPFLDILLMYLMNDDIDKPIRVWDDMFLPDELETNLLQLNYEDADSSLQKAVSSRMVVYKPERDDVPAVPPVHWPWALLSGIFTALAGGLLVRWMVLKESLTARILTGSFNLLLGLVLGIPGLALAYFALFSHHTLAWYNENLLLANPFTFLIIPASIALLFNKTKARKWLACLWLIQAAGGLLAVLLKVFPAFDQDNLLVMAFMLPINLGMAAGWKFLGKNKS